MFLHDFKTCLFFHVCQCMRYPLCNHFFLNKCSVKIWWTVVRGIPVSASVSLATKPATHCHRYSQTMIKLLVREKNWVLWNMTKRVLHTIRYRLQMCVATENYPWIRWKVLCVRWKTAYSSKRISRKSFLRNAHESWWITLYTLFVFGINFIHSSFFIIVNSV